MEIYIIFLQSISCIFGCGLIASILLDRIKENDKFQNYVIKFNQYKDNVFSEFRGFSFWGKDKTKKTFFKIVYIVVTNFLKKELSLRAAGLTFYTLTSIVPILVMMHLFLGTPENGENSVSYAMKVWFHDNEAMNKLDLNSREKFHMSRKKVCNHRKKIITMVVMRKKLRKKLPN